MRWLVGIDLRGRSAGAVQMAAWLRTHARGGAVESVAVHVIAEGLGTGADARAVRTAAEDALAAELRGSSAPPLTAHVVTAASIEAGLAAAAAEHRCDGIVIGRLAASHSRALVRLGTVARRLLRRLPLPVMVVPPDLSAPRIGSGPIVLATDLETTATAAARMAHRLSGTLGRGLAIVHADPSYAVVPDYLGGGAVVVPRGPRRVRADVEQWALAHGLEGAAYHLADGEVTESLMLTAEREAAPLVVTGSRRLALSERIFTSSIGSDLARLSDRPVLVVPTAD
jgi:nucleotide-binding universal stress UspA family protein